MKAKHLFYVLTTVLVLLLLGFAGVAYGTNKLLGAESEKLSHARAEAISLDNQQTTLGKNKSDIQKYSELNEIAKAIVPQDKNQAKAVLEIVNIAKQSGINNLGSITFPASTLGSGVINKAAPGGLTQLTPVKGMAGLYELQITVTQDSASQVPYSQLITFLSKLEQNRRTAQVSSINITPDTKNPNMVSFTLIINEYIKP